MMQSLVIHPARARWVPRLEQVERPRPPRARQVQVQVEQVGVCSMDRSLLLRRHGTPPDPERWVVGHEMVGRVTASGRDVRKIKVGDWVVPTLRRPCGVCAPCRADQPDECTTTFYTEPGLHRAHGWASQWSVDHEAYLVVIPPAIADVALLAEPLALAVKGAQYLATVQRRTLPSCSHFEHRWDQPRWAEDKHILVAGSSVMTIMAALYLRSLGAQVTLCAPLAPPASLGTPLTDAGIVCIAGSVPEGFPAEQVERADALVDTSGDPALIASLVPRLYPNGAIVHLVPFTPLGGHSHDPTIASLSYRALSHPIALVPCYRMGKAHVEMAVQWLADAVGARRFPLSALVDATTPASQFAALVRSPQPWLKSRITLS
ncbi:Starvation-sensing protein RspB [bacterium HR23]|nr:Starvation-sensing protein RspB [bacterium HR23]